MKQADRASVTIVRPLLLGVLVGLGRPHVGCLKALSSLLDVELDGLPFLQRLHATALQCGDVNEHVLALLGLDEAVSPVGVEPLDGAACP